MGRGGAALLVRGRQRLCRGRAAQGKAAGNADRRALTRMSLRSSPLRPSPSGVLLREHAYVGGRWIGAADGSVFPVSDPADGSLICHVADCAEGETNAAIAAASAAFPGWRELSAKERARRLRNWYDLIVVYADELAGILSREQGKPFAEASGEISMA